MRNLYLFFSFYSLIHFCHLVIILWNNNNKKNLMQNLIKYKCIMCKLGCRSSLFCRSHLLFSNALNGRINWLLIGMGVRIFFFVLLHFTMKSRVICYLCLILFVLFTIFELKEWMKVQRGFGSRYVMIPSNQFYLLFGTAWLTTVLIFSKSVVTASQKENLTSIWIRGGRMFF